MKKPLIALLVLGLAVTSAASQERHGGMEAGYGHWRYPGGRPVPGEGHRYWGQRGGSNWRYEPGRGWYDPSVVIGGAIGSWLWSQWNQPQVIENRMTVQDCIQRYRSYNPSTRTYLGFDGQFHACP